MKTTDTTPGGNGMCIACSALLLTCATAAFAQDRAELDKTQVIGNRELPKVLYIVPWKKPQPDTLSGRPVRSVLDEALAPVDREVFRRQVTYDTQLQARAAAPKTEAQGTPSGAAAATQPAAAPKKDPNETNRPAPAGASR